ncbi:hypothetical protein O7605_16995 [Verrucosispora sp. WMMA2121]|uniref:hypothetical protein n=1 Tax=Verrucosispora sp. WMMA2121 TaxID=3015164 RepID=UPI0022B72354|nr:hypothetical protein [Verrucosispora sp. WMMA2121]MCZ7421203.1 hypothetical protein [Verrucosispora sp. WMMA2121]
MREQVWFVIVVVVLATVLPPIAGAAGAALTRLAGLGRAAMIGAFGGVAAFTFSAVMALAMLVATLWAR